MKKISLLFFFTLSWSSLSLAQFLPFPTPEPSQPLVEGTLSKIEKLDDLKSLLTSPDDEPAVKFLIKETDEGPRVYFMSSEFPWHYQLASKLDGVDYDKTQFSKDCQNHSTGFTCGFLKYIPPVAQDDRDYNQERYLWYLYHDDQTSPAEIKRLHAILEKKLPFSMSVWIGIGDGPGIVRHSSWMPQGETQEGWAAMADLKETYPVFPHQLLKKGEEKILNPGFAVGTLRVIRDVKEIPTLAMTDLVLLDMDHIPLDLPPVAGVISRVNQHPLSHINLLSKNRGTPNVYIHGVLEHPHYSNLIGKKVKFRARANRVRMLLASDSEMEKFWSQKRPTKTTTLAATITPMDVFDLKTNELTLPELKKLSGAKAANLTAMSRIPDYPVPSFLLSIPFYWYQDHITTHGILDSFREKLNTQAMKDDFEFRAKILKDLRRAIKKAPVNDTLMQKLESWAITNNRLNKPFRFRSSSNAEDLKFFNGAGLYDSKTGYFNPPTGLEKKTIAKAIRKVWASLWNLQAYQEREFYRIDHESAKMAILMQPSYPTLREKANGVALVKNISGSPEWGFELNIADGDCSITNPEPGADCRTASVFVHMYGDDLTIPTPTDQWSQIASEEELKTLALQLRKAQMEMAPLLNLGSAKLDFEFKWIDDNRDLLIKQVRPLRTKTQYFNGFTADKSKSGKDLSSYYNVYYYHCSSPYIDYVEENGDTGLNEPDTSHIELTVKKDIPELNLFAGESFEFINSNTWKATEDSVLISHPFMHHGPYDLSLTALGHPKIQYLVVPSLGYNMTINEIPLDSPVSCKPEVVYTNWPRTLEREMAQ